MDEDKKAMIADSFQRHYNHFGYRKTTLDEIARDCGISKKTIYSFFRNKEDVYSFIVRRKSHKYCFEMGQKIKLKKTISEKLEKLVEMTFAENLAWIKRGNSAFEFENKYEIASKAFQNAYQDLLKIILDDGVGKNEIPKQDIDLKVRFICSLIAEGIRLFNEEQTLSMKNEVCMAVEKLIR